MTQRTAVILFLGLLATSSYAQVWDRMTTPEIPVTIQHPSVVKMPVEHVAFVEPQGGECAAALTDALVADFAASGTTVLDRAHLKALAAEHKLNVSSGLVDERTVAKIGKLIGSGALIFVRVHECKVTRSQLARDYTDRDGTTRRRTINKATGVLRASVQATNLTTGITVGARMVNATVTLPKEEDSNAGFGARLLSATTAALVSGGNNDAPPDDVILTGLQNDAVVQVHKLFFPWSEARKLHFYDDKQCSLGTALRLLRGGDNEGAAVEAQASLELCKSMNGIKPAVLAHAHYNVGMTQFILGNHDAALEALGHAVRLDGGSIITFGMAECRRAQALAKEAAATSTPAAGVSAPTPKVTAAAVSSKPSSTEERLKKLTDLHKKGIITDDEYKNKRAEILKDM